MEIEELQAAKRKQDKEMEALNDRIEELKAENQKALKSKKKVQEEVRNSPSRPFFLRLAVAATTPCKIQL